MPGGIQQDKHCSFQQQHRLLCEDSDALVAFHLVGVQKRIIMIHPSGLFQPPVPIKQRFS